MKSRQVIDLGVGYTVDAELAKGNVFLRVRNSYGEKVFADDVRSFEYGVRADTFGSRYLLVRF